MGDDRITAWDTVSDYLIGGAAGVGGFLLGFSKAITILIAMTTFVAWNLRKHLFRRWRRSGEA